MKKNKCGAIALGFLITHNYLRASSEPVLFMVNNVTINSSPYDKDADILNTQNFNRSKNPLCVIFANPNGFDILGYASSKDYDHYDISNHSIFSINKRKAKVVRTRANALYVARVFLERYKAAKICHPQSSGTDIYKYSNVRYPENCGYKTAGSSNDEEDANSCSNEPREERRKAKPVVQPPPPEPVKQYPPEFDFKAPRTL